MAASEDIITIPSGAYQLVGMLHRPVGAPKGGIVFCYPFGEERKSSHRAFVHTARAFAEAGFGALRFDYRGCGDSSGEFHEATVDGWLEDIEAAAAALRSNLSLEKIGLLGLRFGATLAVRAAERIPDVADLILWEPVIDGRSYFAADLRKKLIKEMMTRGKTAGSRTALLDQLERGEGQIDLDGYRVTGKLYAGLAGLNLPHLITNFRGRCFLCQVSFTDKIGAHVNALKECYTRCGASATLTAVIEESFWNKIDFAGCPKLIKATLGWLDQSAN
jgi:exosortase A-associated hydrolase 2